MSENLWCFSARENAAISGFLCTYELGLSEEVRFQGGRVLDLNFDTYELPRFSWVPKIETILLETDPSRPLGCGEPPIICMGAVVANAVYDATGVRLLQLPMTTKRVKEALAARPKAAASVS